jgi:hypothetical protein
VSGYHTIFALGFIRAVVGSLVVVAVVPRLILPRLFPGEPWRNRVGGVLVVGAILLGIVHGLVLANLNDSVSFALVLGSIIVIRFWYSYIRVSDKHLKNHLASLLRFLDSNSARSIFVNAWKRCAAISARWTAFQYMDAVLLIFILAMTGFIRVLPAWNHAAPFSVEYYETLQKVKELQINQMYTDGYRVPLGLPMAAQVLGFFSQVNSSLLLHFLGALSSIFLAASITYVVYRSTFSVEGAIVGAAVFGLFSVLLPLDLRPQVEADSLILATAFALPSLAFAVEFCVQPGYKPLLVALSGFFVAAAVNLFVGFLTVIAIALILLASLVFAFRIQWLRGMKLISTLAVTAILVLGFVLFFRAGMARDSFKYALEILLYDKHLNRYFSMYAGLAPAFDRACYGMFGLTVVLSVMRYSNKTVSLQLLSWGLMGIGIVALIPYSYNGILSYIQFSQLAFVLAIVAAVSAGILVSLIGVGGAALLRNVHAKAWMASTWKILIALGALSLFWYNAPPQKVQMEFTAEPDGFATSLYLIEQKFMPYQWTVVSHRGTALSGMNRGRFLDYEYFVEKYDPLTYKHGTSRAVPTPLLFFFVERAHQKTEITTEISSTDRNAEQKIENWLGVYEQKNHNLKIFYSDDKVVVYELEDHSFNALRG